MHALLRTPLPGAAVLLGVLVYPGWSRPVTVIRELQHGVSAPMRDVAAKPAAVMGVEPDEGEDEGGALLPAVNQADPVLQKTAGRTLMITPGLNLLGLGSGFVGPQGSFQFAFTPPDPTASVGANQVVETVNLSWAVFDKVKGTPILGPASIPAIWNGFNSACSSTARLAVADPVVLYDKQAGRWVIELVTLGSTAYSCFAVSTSSDATGTYNLYAFELAASGFKATPRFGVWPDGYYLSIRRYDPPSTYLGPQACAVDRSQMLAGQAATMQCFQVADTRLDGMLSADLDGTAPPPAGSPEYYLVQGPAGSNSLYLYQFHVDFAHPANSTFTGPTIIPVAPYTAAPIRSGVPQLGSTQILTAIGNCLMHRLAYRYFPNAPTPYECLLATHSVMAGSSSSRRVAVRWYELHDPGSSSPTVFQQGTYSPDANDRWMGSIAMDKHGNIAIGYSVSSATMYPEIRYTGRMHNDPPGTLSAEVTIFGGSGSQIGTNRWGDFTSMSLDPADDCTMWYTNEYMPATQLLDWATRIFSFRFSGCQ
jgi:hypothetical protein